MSKEKVIKLLSDTLKDNNLDKIEYKDENFEIILSKNTENSVSEIKNTINSKLVGNFYASKTPLDPPLIKVGDEIKEGQVIAIIQAMKVSNEVKSDGNYIVKNIVAKNGEFVDFDAPLFEVEEI